MDPKIEQRFVNVTRSKTFANIRKTYRLEEKSVLDIGCSHGEFLAHFGKGSVGITIIQDEVEYGIAKGLDIRYGNIEDEAFVLNETFDVIFANNIFEHLYSPHAFLQQVRSYLKPGGILILGVPCIPYLSFLSRFKKFRGAFAVAHINFFTKGTLAWTLKHGGWVLESIRGFRIFNAFLDHFLDPIYPHFYAVAKPDPSFTYGTKRMKELAGYQHN